MLQDIRFAIRQILEESAFQHYRRAYAGTRDRCQYHNLLGRRCGVAASVALSRS